MESRLLVYAAVLLTGIFVFSAQVLVYAFVGHLYPPEIRGTALGVAAGVGRVGAIVGPTLGGTLVTAGIAYPWGFYAFTLAAVLAVLTLATVPAHAHVVDSSAGVVPVSGRLAAWPATRPTPAPGDQPGARAARRVRRGAPPTRLTELAAVPSCRCRPRTAWPVSWPVGRAGATSSGEYVVGRRLWDLGLLAPLQAGLVETASPFLHDLYGATLATVHLAVRDGRGALSRPGARARVGADRQHVGCGRRRMHGVGKVLLAHAPADVQRGVLRELPGSRRTPSPRRGSCAASWPSAARRLRHHGRGDEPRRLLGRGADPGAATRWWPRSAWSHPVSSGRGRSSSPRSRWRRMASAARSGNSSQGKRRVARIESGALD